MCLNSTTKQKREKSWDWKEEIRDLMEFEWEAVDGVSATFTKQLNADDVIKLVEKLLKQREEKLERKHKEELELLKLKHAREMRKFIGLCMARRRQKEQKPFNWENVATQEI